MRVAQAPRALVLLFSAACAEAEPNPFAEATGASPTEGPSDAGDPDVEDTSSSSGTSGDTSEPGCHASSTDCETRPLTSQEAWIAFKGCACAEGNLVLDNFRAAHAVGGRAALIQLYGNLTVENGGDDLGMIFPNLYVVEGSIRFSNIYSDGPLRILQNITAPRGNLILKDVHDVDALAHIVGVEGDFDITGVQPDLDELINLRSVTGVLGLATEDQRLPLTLESVGGLWVHEGRSPMLTFTRPLEIKNDLVIVFNHQLASFVGLEHLGPVGGDVRIEDNPTLPDCEIVRLIEALENTGFAGELSVCRNLADECTAQLPPCG